MAPPVEEDWFKPPLASFAIVSSSPDLRSRSSPDFIYGLVAVPVHGLVAVSKLNLQKKTNVPGFEPTTFLIQASVRYEAHTNPQDHDALAVTGKLCKF